MALPLSLRRLSYRPFATALGFLLFAGAITALSNVGLTQDALLKLVPNWLLDCLSLAYGTGGLLLLLGMSRDRGNIEASGCILVVSGLLVRTIALLYVLGFTPATISTAVFYVVFGWACLERFRQIVRGDHIVRIHQDVEIRFEGVPDDRTD